MNNGDFDNGKYMLRNIKRVRRRRKRLLWFRNEMGWFEIGCCCCCVIVVIGDEIKLVRKFLEVGIGFENWKI